jgi:hypothetical protein
VIYIPFSHEASEFGSDRKMAYLSIYGHSPHFSIQMFDFRVLDRQLMKRFVSKFLPR